MAGPRPFRTLSDVHPYRMDKTSPESGDLLGDIRRLQRLIAEFGNNQAIWFSEIGWSTVRDTTKPFGLLAVTELQQAS